MQEYTKEDVAGHSSKDDLWVIIKGKVYDVTTYVRDHPGGADVLIDVAGADATEAYEDVGHSEDADEILQSYLIGTEKGAQQHVRAKPVRLIPSEEPASKPLPRKAPLLSATLYLGGSLGSLYFAPRLLSPLPLLWSRISNQGLVGSLSWQPLSKVQSFCSGVAVASVICTTFTIILALKLSKMVQIKSGFTKYPAYVTCTEAVRPTPQLPNGFLDPKEFKSLPLFEKTALSSNTYRFRFKLPRPQDVIGLPIGQHVAIKAVIDGKAVSRSYTPTSNDSDPGLLELVVKCYSDGLLTGKYLEHLQVGDLVQFRGPKGAMKYSAGLCKKIGMIAGGTGITPMYQIIRAICEDPNDFTEVSLIYANRTEDDILLRHELDTFARNNPKNFKVWYMLDSPPAEWAYGKGHVTADIMSEKLPATSPDTKAMLCGPPGMVKASLNALSSLGFQAPGPISKMTDQIFCF